MTTAGPRLILDRQHLVGMLSDPDFYAQCPTFLWLKTSALQAFRQYSASNVCCGGDFEYMKPIVTAFFENLRELHTLNPEHVQPVRLYLSSRKKKKIGPILIHYRTSLNESAQFTF